MTASILDGKRVAAEIRAEVAADVARLAGEGITPDLDVVLVGEDPASHVYVNAKANAARSVGIRETTHRYPRDLDQGALLATIDRLNADSSVDAILVQLPLPKHIDTARVLEAIDPAKDADGFHPVNVGRLVQGKPAPIPCTPAGILELLVREGVEIAGKRSVVVGRSDIVGKPMATLLLKADATVTISHSKTRDLPGVCREADILIVALGRAGFVTGEYVKPGAVVVDVGINRVSRREDVERFFPGDAGRLAEWEKKGSTLVGDCDPSSVPEQASRLTPVPGGVGPLTIARLLFNTVQLARARR